MCNQTVSLVAAEMERRGITTVVIQLLRGIARAMRPPRALWVPYPLGYPFGAPEEPALQHRVLAAALGLVEETDAEPPLLRDFEPGAEVARGRRA